MALGPLLRGKMQDYARRAEDARKEAAALRRGAREAMKRAKELEIIAVSQQRWADYLSGDGPCPVLPTDEQPRRTFSALER